MVDGVNDDALLANERFDELIEFDAGGGDDDEGSSRLLCIFCYAEFDDLDAVRAHMMKEHDCIPLDNYPHRSVVVVDDGRVAGNQTDENVQHIPTSLTKELSVKRQQKNAEGDWMKPISLKDLKRKLRKTFTFK